MWERTKSAAFNSYCLRPNIPFVPVMPSISLPGPNQRLLRNCCVGWSCVLALRYIGLNVSIMPISPFVATSPLTKSLRIPDNDMAIHTTRCQIPIITWPGKILDVRVMITKVLDDMPWFLHSFAVVRNCITMARTRRQVALTNTKEETTFRILTYPFHRWRSHYPFPNLTQDSGHLLTSERKG